MAMDNYDSTIRALMRDNSYKPGLRIAAWRGLYGRRTLSDTAHDLGIHVSTLGRYERGTGSPPGGATAHAILHHIGIPVAHWYPPQTREENNR